MATRMLQRRGTAAEWAAANPVLAAGEIGYETDTHVQKVGDGVTAWNSLTMSWVPVGGGVLLTNPISHPAPTQDAHTARRIDVDNAIAQVGPYKPIVYLAGSHTFIKGNYSYLKRIRVQLLGGGGGGSGAGADTGDTGGGGGGACYVESWFEESELPASVPIVVGTGGTGGGGQNSGADGGDSTWDGTVMISKGGGGGNPVDTAGQPNNANGSPGSWASSTGQIKVVGSNGGMGGNIGGFTRAGDGGAAAMFGAVRYGQALKNGGSLGGQNGLGYGSGGSAALNDGGGNGVGGTGSNGVCIVTIIG